MGLKFSTGETEYENMRLKGAVAELGNAVIAFFWDGDEPLLGTLTVTLPSRISSHLMGDKDRIIGQVIGEQLTVHYGKMAVVSTNISKFPAVSVGKNLLELARKLAGVKGRDTGEVL